MRREALIVIPVHIDIIDDITLTHNQLELLEHSLNNVVNVGDIGNILSANELEISNVLNHLDLDVALDQINVCANVVGGLLCK